MRKALAKLWLYIQEVGLQGYDEPVIKDQLHLYVPRQTLNWDSLLRRPNYKAPRFRVGPPYGPNARGRIVLQCKPIPTRFLK